MDKLPVQKERNLYLAKQVDQSSINDITKEIVEINEDDAYLKRLYGVHNLEYNPSPIKLYIDSYGGKVYQCMGLVGLMSKSDTPIHTIVTGAAMSCGFIITLAGHNRFAYDSATLLYHQVSTVQVGKVKDIDESLIQTKKLQKWMEDYTYNRTDITRAKLKEVYDTKLDWFMTAEEAKELKVIDEIL